jgi:hypothetical protein
MIWLVLISAIVRSNYYLSRVITYLLFLLTANSILLRKKIKKFKKMSWIILFLIIVSFLAISLYESAEWRGDYLKEPKAEKYSSDRGLYLKTFYYQKKGWNYYPAFTKSYFEDARSISLPPDLWGFRLPTTFFIWQLLPNAYWIYYLFLLNCCVILALSYLVAQKFSSNKAIIAPFLIMPYLLYGSTTGDMEFLQMGWWGILPMIIFCYAVLNKQTKLRFVSALWAMMTRTLYLIPLAVVGILSILFRRPKMMRPLVAAAFIFLIFFLFHSYFVFQMIPYNLENIFTGRTHHGHGLEMIRQVLVFGTWRYLFAPYRLFTIYLFIDLFGKAFLFFKNKMLRFKLIFLTCLYFPTLIAFLKIGHCCWSDYWGVVVGPLLVFNTAITLILLDKTFKNG